MYTYYTVQRGDTLKGIADSFGIGVEQIQGANGIMNAYYSACRMAASFLVEKRHGNF